MQRRLSFKPAFVGTIHKFAYDLLEDMAINYGFKLNLLRDYQTKAVVKHLALKNDFNAQDALDVYNFMSDKRFFLLNNRIVPSHFRFLENQYNKLKQDTKFYDLTDSPNYLLEKMQSYKLTKFYDCLFVDEAQDLSTEQFELIEQLPIEYKFVIGDPKQSIYMFRGADGSVFEKFINDGYREYSLTVNYRSYQEILNRAGAELTSIRGNGGIIYDDMVELLKKHPRILCRSNQEVQNLEYYYDNVSTIHAAKGLEFENVIVIPFEISSPEDINILYVANTRAKDGIGESTLTELLKILKK